MTLDRELLVILGNTNSPDGKNLSDDAISRIESASEYILRNPNLFIVTTGGFGGYFNISNIAHGALLRESLLKSELNGGTVLPHIHSVGTVQDALGVLRLIRERKVQPKLLTIITNGYHSKRVEYIFSRLLPFVTLKVISDERNGTQKQKKHEIKRLKNATWSIPIFANIGEEIEGAPARLHEEVKHYDNLSYLALAAAFLTIWLFSQNAVGSFQFGLEQLGVATVMLLVLPFVLSVIFFLIYLRLAGTAASARRSLEAISFLTGQPSLSSGVNLFGEKIPNILRLAVGAMIAAWLITWATLFVPTPIPPSPTSPQSAPAPSRQPSPHPAPDQAVCAVSPAAPAGKSAR